MALVSDQQVLDYLQAASGVTVPAAGQTVLTMLRPMVEGAVKALLGYNLEQATYTEFYPEALANGYFDGDDVVAAGYDLVGQVVVPRSRSQREFAALALREMPPRSVTSVYENPGAWAVAGGSFPAGTLLPTNAYYLDCRQTGTSWTGLLRRISGTWSRIPRTIKVTYLAGFASDEIDAQFPQARLAVLLAMASAYIDAVQRSRFGKLGGPVGSVSIEDFSVSYQPMQPKAYALPPESVALLAPYCSPSKYVGL